MNCALAQDSPGSASIAKLLRPTLALKHGREEPPYLVKQKIFEFCQLNVRRDTLHHLQLNVYHELEAYVSTITELDISGIPGVHLYIEQYIQHSLQYLHNMKKLSMNNTQLKTIPASIGSLRHLEVLSVQNNHLKTLPFTLTFCQNLSTLNLQFNHLQEDIPGMLLRLEKLEKLTYTPQNKPLKDRYKKPHARSQIIQQDHQGESLYTLCIWTVFKQKINYWNCEIIGSLQRKNLDELGSSIDLCENCQKPVFLRTSELNVDLPNYDHLGNQDTNFVLSVCSAACKDQVTQRYKRRAAAKQPSLTQLSTEEKHCDELLPLAYIPTRQTRHYSTSRPNPTKPNHHGENKAVHLQPRKSVFKKLKDLVTK